MAESPNSFDQESLLMLSSLKFVVPSLVLLCVLVPVLKAEKADAKQVVKAAADEKKLLTQFRFRKRVLITFRSWAGCYQPSGASPGSDDTNRG